jgi:hypothetical protein
MKPTGGSGWYGGLEGELTYFDDQRDEMEFVILALRFDWFHILGSIVSVLDIHTDLALTITIAFHAH